MCIPCGSLAAAATVSPIVPRPWPELRMSATRVLPRLPANPSNLLCGHHLFFTDIWRTGKTKLSQTVAQLKRPRYCRKSSKHQSCNVMIFFMAKSLHERERCWNCQKLLCYFRTVFCAHLRNSGGTSLRCLAATTGNEGWIGREEIAATFFFPFSLLFSIFRQLFLFCTVEQRCQFGFFKTRLNKFGFFL